MKSFKLIALLVAVTMVLTSLGVAGVAKNSASSGISTGKVNTPQMSVGSRFQNRLTGDPDVQGRPAKSIRMSPVPVQKSEYSPAPTQLLKKEVAVPFSGGLSGLYHIPGDFSSIGNAVAVLNFVGLAGATTFQLDATSYTELPVTFGNYAGNESTLTVQPGPGVAVTVNFLYSNSNGKGFAFNGAKNITIDGLNTGGASLTLTAASTAVFPLGDPFGSTVYITGASNQIAVKNATVHGIVNDPVWANQTEGRSGVFVFQADADAASNTNITLDGLTITNATFGIKALCESGSYNAVDGFTVANCRIGGAYGNPVVVGALANYCSAVNYHDNIVDGVTYLDWYWNNTYTEYDVEQVFNGAGFMYNLGQSTGGHWLLMDGGSVFHNNIWRNIGISGVAGEGLLTYGERIYAYNLGLGGVADAYNNRISGITGPGGAGSQINGMRGPTSHLYHNSVHLTGSTAAGTTVNGINNGGGVIKNNAVDVNVTGPSSSSVRGIATGGTINYNAVNSNGRFISGFTSAAAAAAAGQNTNGTFGPINFTADLHLDPNGPSAAEDAGVGGLLAATDVDGDARSLTTPDAGADEVAAPLTNATAADVSPGDIPFPTNGGPTGLAVAPVVTVKNNTIHPEGPFNVHLAVSDGYSQTVAVSLLAGEVKQVTFPAWTPAGAGNFTFTATTQLGTDGVTGNDVLALVKAVSAPVAAPVAHTWDATAEQWIGANDFGTAPRTFTKLGGVYGGSGKSWVTNCPSNAATYTEGAYANTEGYSATYPGPNTVTSPWYNMTALPTDVYISFNQSLAVEPGWDGSWWEYTTDNVHWKHLGVVNDPNGVNWYNSSVYANTPSFTGDPPDTATMKFPQYSLYGTPNDNTTVPIAWWSSNGPAGPPASVDPETGIPLGPFGYVYSQLHITAANYPDIVGAPLVKFRFVAFADAVNPPGGDLAATVALGMQGWAIDNFSISATAPVPAGNTITGHVYLDQNGNGVDDAEPAEVGLTVNLDYFGVPKATTTTDASGNYSFTTLAANGGLPGLYHVTIVHNGYAFTQPFASNVQGANTNSDGSTVYTLNFGDYAGSVSGVKFNDLNNNGANDSEPGLAGWTIEVHKDSANGALVGSAVSAVGGAYSIPLPPHATYVAKEVHQASTRQTAPAGGTYTFGISGASGSGTANLTGKDFGNFILASIRVAMETDANGDGTRQGSDQIAIPAPNSVRFTITKTSSAGIARTDTLGGGISSLTHTAQDTGTYEITRLDLAPAGWEQTKPAAGNPTVTIVVSNSGEKDTASFLMFKDPIVSGGVFDDVNGDGSKNAGDAADSGWTVQLDGSPAATSDSLGNYSLLAGPGNHTVTLVPPSGYSLTAGSGGYPFAAVSGNLGGNQPGKDFGSFKNVTISGVKYRDRNNNGTRDAGEEGLAGWTINVGNQSTVTDANGNWSISGFGAGTDTVTEVAQPGYVMTEPAAGFYAVTTSSGTDVAGLAFGNYLSADDATFRTFTAAELAAGDGKLAKVWKIKTPTVPNVQNMIAQTILQGGIIQAGLSGQMFNGKELAYIAPVKQGDVYKSFNSKGAQHTGAPDGLSFTNTGKQMFKKQKSITAAVKNDVFIADLLALKVNLAASGLKTPANLGNLIYADANSVLNGKTIAQIASQADGILTNWTAYSLHDPIYTAYDSVIAKINAAFSGPWAYDSASWTTGKVIVKGVRTVFEAGGFLKANPGAPPVTPPPARQLPKTFALYQNYPNPFNPTTSIDFDLPQSAIVTLKIYNILGQEVATLVDHQTLDAGQQEFDFDATAFSSGVYLYRIIAEQVNDDGISTGHSFTKTMKMVLLK